MTATGKDIPIQFESKIEDEQMKIIVYTKNFSKSIYSRNENCVVWQVLDSNKDTQTFYYSNQLYLSSEYTCSGLLVKSGPFPVKHGSTWRIVFDRRDDVALLEKVPLWRSHPNGKIMIYYKDTKNWTGIPFDIKIFRSDRLQLIYPQLHPGKEIEFVLPPKLFFGVVHKSVQRGTVLNNLNDVMNETVADISYYPNGLKVLADKSSATEVSFNLLPLR